MGKNNEFLEEEIIAQKDKILSSFLFSQSHRQCRFLQYILDQSLSGNADKLKGYTIGVDVFDRDESFDPNIDSIVRVEAGRLRSKLREYYQTEGQDDVIFIELPKGSYSPQFSRNDKNESTSNQHYKIENSIAVLPFRTLSDDVSLGYFSDGMTDAIITALAKRKSLKVISNSSVTHYKNSNEPIKQIADNLKVSHVVTGNIFKDDNLIRISAQLIECDSVFHVWSESYEREVKNILHLQKEVADSIAACLTEEIGVGKNDSKRDDEINPKAYELFLLGQRTRAQFTKQSFYKAADYFNQAIELDPNYAEAYGGLASCFCGLGSHGFELECPTDIIPKGLDYADDAINIDHSLVDPHTYKGIMKLKYDWDWPGAEDSFKKALAISPNNVRAHMQFSMYFESMGQHEQAISEGQEALYRDPLSREVNMNLIWQYCQAGKYDKGKDRLNYLMENEPDFWGTYWDQGYIQLAEENYEAAIESFKQAYETQGGYSLPLQGLGYAYAMSGDKDSALNVIEELKNIQESSYVSPYYYATIYLGLNEIDKTFDYLEKAFEVRSRSLVWINVAREYQSLKSDERFQKLIKRIGIPS